MTGNIWRNCDVEEPSSRGCSGDPRLFDGELRVRRSATCRENQQPAEKIEPNFKAPAPVVSPTAEATAPAAVATPTPAPAATPAAAVGKAECKDVVVTRPDVGSLKKFTLTFSGIDFDAFNACNPNAEVDKTANGDRIVIAYGLDGAKVSLPVSADNGSVHLGRCVNDEAGSVKDVTLYRAEWSGELPTHVDMKVVDKALFDHDALLATCKQLTAQGKFH
jgi:hypothetical protein